MLQNISVRFDPVEDRLVLRLTCLEREQRSDHWLLLTRRVCVQWCKDLQAMMDLSSQAPERLDSHAKTVFSAAHHVAVASQVPIRREAAAVPDAESELTLVTKASCGRRRNDGRWVVKFEFRDREPLVMVLSSPTLHALADVIAQRVSAANWGIAVGVTQAAPPAQEKARSIH